MEEKLIISGRQLPDVDPVLRVWHWEIPFYLFVGGMAAGILFFAAYYYLRGREGQYPTAVKIAPLLVPVLLGLGLLALFADLRHKLYFWQLYTTVRLSSPMSWGAWTLMLVTPLSIAWVLTYVRELFPALPYPAWFARPEAWLQAQRRPMAWMLIVSSVVLGIYTGILLSAFNARPLWNTSILGPLFLASGLSAGAAAIMMMSRNPIERAMFGRIDLVIILIELFLIVHMFMGFLASTKVQIEAAQLFLGGPYTLVFWVFVVTIGLLVPALLEIWEMRGKKIPVYIPAVLVLLGSLMLRFVIVYAGQASRYL